MYRQPARDLGCPRCGVQLALHQRLRGCSRCGGLWVPTDQLARVLAEEPRHWLWWRRPQLACPVCDDGMGLVLIGDRLVDRCDAHGIWFDRGEHREVLPESPEPLPPPPPPPPRVPPPFTPTGSFDLGAVTERIDVVALEPGEGFETGEGLAWHVYGRRALGAAEVTELLSLWTALRGSPPRATHRPTVGLEVSARGEIVAHVAISFEDGTISIRSRGADHRRVFDPRSARALRLRALLAFG